MLGSSGDAALNKPPSLLYAEYAHAADLDTAKVNFTQMGRWLAAETNHKKFELEKVVESIVELLGHLKLD